MTTFLEAAAPEATPRTQRRSGQSTFRPLINRIKSSGLMGGATRFYVVTGIALVVATAAIVAGLVLLSGSWWALLLAPLLAIVWGQISFVAHDAGHKQLPGPRSLSHRVGLVAANVLLGVSFGYWNDKHDRHHANPNHEGLDPDVAEGIITWSERQHAKKTGLGLWMARHQAGLFFPLLTFQGWGLQVEGINWLRRRPRGSRLVEGLLLTLHFALYFGLLLWFLSPLQALAFLAIHEGIWGFMLASVFAPNHKGMEMLDITDTEKLDHLQKQVPTSRNIIGSPVVDFFMGGLNYQVEHHLFPSMPRAHLKDAQPIVEEYCHEIDLPYVKVGVTESYGQILRYLHAVGTGQRPERLV
ncbi:fatty acid desaturase family protein [Raineyella fluvialis]|uniref:Acyl-CoA desaturase n=1 Tax=Raineyella fluvialis TaxID=2662261 RepID=A0A5Q2F7U1_9ACTN|nr:acyl-CoA desaturase [Raineyella fluvialis]QGF23050.1 acyl-CoA desaturase [Raineyella fluvialis]